MVIKDYRSSHRVVEIHLTRDKHGCYLAYDIRCRLGSSPTRQDSRSYAARQITLDDSCYADLWKLRIISICRQYVLIEVSIYVWDCAENLDSPGIEDRLGFLCVTATIDIRDTIPAEARLQSSQFSGK